MHTKQALYLLGWLLTPDKGLFFIHPHAVGIGCVSTFWWCPLVHKFLFCWHPSLPIFPCLDWLIESTCSSPKPEWALLVLAGARAHTHTPHSKSKTFRIRLCFLGCTVTFQVFNAHGVWRLLQYRAEETLDFHLTEHSVVKHWLDPCYALTFSIFRAIKLHKCNLFITGICPLPPNLPILPVP